MHRTNRVPHAPLGALLVLGLLIGGAAVASAQKKPVDEVAPPPRPAAGPTPRTIPAGSTVRVQMSGKQPITIAQVINEKENVVRVTPITNDPTTVQITGLTPGLTRLTFTSAAEPGKPAVTEIVEVTVELDVGLLRSLMRQAVPTAMVNVVPGAGNSIILTGTVNRSEDIEVVVGIARSVVGAGVGTGAGAGQAGAQIINALRVGGVFQVQLDVVVAVVSRQEIRQMGVTFERQGLNSLISSTIGGNLQVPAGTIISTGAGGGGGGGGGAGPGAGALTITNIASSPLVFLGLGTGTANPLFAFVNALRENDLAKIVAEPHLVTLSGHPAYFLSGGQQAVPQVSGFGGTAGVTFMPFGTQIQFLPIVLGNGKIYMDVLPSISQLNAASGVQIPGGGFVPGRAINSVQTSVIVEDGQTFAVGGLIQHTVQASTQKYPWVGDMPFLGVLFSTKQYNDQETELIVLVTPHLVDPMDCKQVPRFLPGMETRNPDDFELFLEGILEAPRGQREVNHDRHYVAPWKNGPTAQCYPCLGGGPGNPTPCYPKGAPCGGSATPEAIIGAGQGTPPGAGGSGGAGGCCGPTLAPVDAVVPAVGTQASGGVVPVGGPVMGLVSPADDGSAGGSLPPVNSVGPR